MDGEGAKKDGEREAKIIDTHERQSYPTSGDRKTGRNEGSVTEEQGERGKGKGKRFR